MSASLTDVIAFFDSSGFIERYSYFCAFRVGEGNAFVGQDGAVLDQNGELTQVGKVWLETKSNAPVVQENFAVGHGSSSGGHGDSSGGHDDSSDGHDNAPAGHESTSTAKSTGAVRSAGVKQAFSPVLTMWMVLMFGWAVGQV